MREGRGDGAVLLKSLYIVKCILQIGADGMGEKSIEFLILNFELSTDAGGRT